MGTHYNIYAEINVNGMWYNLSPTMKKYDGTLAVRPVYDSGSFFYSICSDLEDHRTGIGIPDDMSAELRSLFRKNLDEKHEALYPDMTCRDFYDQSIFSVRYSDTVANRIIKDKEHKYEGYVSKRLIAAFEVNETEEIYNWLTTEEYMALPEKDKRLYRFYGWDEPYDEYYIYRTIYERLCAMLYWFSYADAFEDRSGSWGNRPVLSDVRLIIERF